MDKLTQLIEFLLGDESFHRLVDGSASRNDVEKWDRWADQSFEHREAFDQAFTLLKNLRFIPSHYPSVEERWKRFYHNTKLSRKVTPLRGYSDDNGIPRYSSAMRYAAIFFIASLVAAGYWLISGKNETRRINELASNVVISTSYREQKTLKFSDGSKIILAPHSRLVHSSKWLKEKVKKVSLDGQAYFDISDKKPSGLARFEVTTPFGTVRDFGTVFNVSTFDKHTSVVLERGIVSVTPNGTAGSGKTKSVRLKPGQMATLTSNSDHVNIQRVNPQVYTSWTTKTLYFEHTPLKEFINDIKNFYGASVVVRDSALLNKKLSGGVDRGSLKDMIKVVSSVLNIPMHVKHDTVYVGDFFNNNTQE